MGTVAGHGHWVPVSFLKVASQLYSLQQLTLGMQVPGSLTLHWLLASRMGSLGLPPEADRALALALSPVEGQHKRC